MACQSLGFSQSASTEFQASNSSNFMSLKDDATLNATIAEGHRLYSMLKSTKEACAEGAVEIQCQEFSKFGCELKMCYLIPPLIQFFIFIYSIPACGTHSPSAESIAGRLAGGDGAASGSQPWVAILYNSRVKSSCTASIISPRWLLASYNCLHMKYVVHKIQNIFHLSNPTIKL